MQTKEHEPKRKKRRLLDKYPISDNFKRIIYFFIDGFIDEMPKEVAKHLKILFPKEKLKKLRQKILKARKRNKECPKKKSSK